MMTTRAYYGGDYDSLPRPSCKAPTTAHYSRAVPYAQPDRYAPPMQELQSRYGIRANNSVVHTIVQEQSPEAAASANVRRRIQVACSRCRRRKIKCTGDPGDGSGCSACRNAADRSDCTFIRVGSQPLSLPGSESILPADGATPTMQSRVSYGSDVTTGSCESSSYQKLSSLSVPVLQTRTEYPEYDSYNTSPVEDYAYVSPAYSRHLSLSSRHHTENFRPYTASSSVSTSEATPLNTYYEPGTAFNFGNFQAGGHIPSAPLDRSRSISADTFRPLNMGSLHSSLPTQTVQERRLPVPYTQAYQPPTHLMTELPQLRGLTSFSGRQRGPQLSGIHSLAGMFWSADSAPNLTPQSSVSNTELNVLPTEYPRTSTNSILGESILGYQFSAAPASPESSPTTSTTLSGSFAPTAISAAASSMLPSPVITRYNAILNVSDETSLRPSSSREAAASLYSFSTGVDVFDRSSSDHNHIRPNSTDHGHVQPVLAPQRSYPSTEQPQAQPQCTAGIEELRGHSLYDQRAATAHRVSVSSLNGIC